jgi:signal peptidase II
VSRRVFYFLAAAAVLAADQASKFWAVAELKGQRAWSIIPGVFSLEYTENSGIALGFLGDGGDLIKWALITVSVAAAVFVVGYLLRASYRERLLLAALSLLLAGIAGNLLDRLARGYVVDFISFSYEPNLLRSSARPAETPPQPVAEQKVNFDENA